MAGRVILIQSVLSALPTYIMQTTYLPDHVVTELEKIMRKFLWGNDAGRRRLHGVSWEKVCLPKTQGGLNLRDVRKANLALFFRNWGGILSLTRILFGLERKYLRHHDFFDVPSKASDSYTWRSILKGREVLLKSLGVNVSNGKTTSFWRDHWMPDSPLIQHALQPLS